MSIQIDKETILLTKLQPPQIKKNTLTRSRLLYLLNENLDRKLILINAGAGYGKTTLVSQFLPDIKIPHIFYHLEASDSALIVFISYLTSGIKNICPEFGKRTLAILNSLQSSEGYLEVIVGTFINELVEKISNDLLIILDDYHNIKPTEQIDQALNYLFKHTPPSLHFIISTRHTPNFLSPKMKARREIYEISNQDLKFTGEEIKKLFRNIHSITLGESEIKVLEKHTEGWITSLQLILQSLKDNVIDILKLQDFLSDIKAYSRWPEDHFNYFAQEIYNRESEDIKQFMVDCSILEWLNQDSCKAITKRDDSGDILHDFEIRNAFLFKTSKSNYRFHNLFREFLFSKLDNPKHNKKIFLKAADYFYKANQLEYAAKLYLQAQHFKKAASIIKKIGSHFFTKDDGNTACTYVESLPKSLVEKDPDLLLLYGNTLMAIGQFDRAGVIIQKAIRLYRKKSKISIKLADAFFRLATLHFLLNDSKSAMKWLIKASYAYPFKAHSIRAAILSSLGLLYSRMGKRKYAAARSCFKEALQIMKKCPEYTGLDASIFNNWAMLERKAGNLNIAYEKLLSAIDLLKIEGNFCTQSGTIFYNAAHIGLQLGEIKSVHSLLKAGEEISKKYNYKISLAKIWAGYAKYYEELGNLHETKEYLKKSMDFFKSLKFKRDLLFDYINLCSVNTKLGLLTEAEKNLSTIWEIKKVKNDEGAVQIHIVDAKLRAAQGKFDTAKKILSSALKLANQVGRTFESFLILLELVKILYKERKIDKVTDILKQALDLCRKRGYDYRLAKIMNIEKWMSNLLLRIDRSYILSILNQYNIPFYLVEISLFGNPIIFVNGRRIKSEMWKTSKAMKLFCYLCCHREKALSRDILIDAIWKDIPLSSSSKSLRKAMQHIRQAFKLIGVIENPIIYKNGLYQVSENLSITMDIEDFTNLAEDTKKSKHVDKSKVNDIKKLVNLYKDGLAKDWYDEWIEQLRRNYNEKYEESLLTIADYYLKKRNYKNSIIWLKMLISNNFYEEEYHKKLWTTYVKLKKYKEIKKDFAKLEQAFKKDLQDKLQLETIELYKSLMK